MARYFRTALSWTRRVLSFDFLPFSDNVNLGLLALALSASLWVFITNEQDPPRTGIFQSRLAVHPVNVPSTLAAIETIDPVIVQITAPSDLWNSLTESSFDATVDLSDVSLGTASHPVRVQAHDARVRVLSVIPSTVNVEVDRLQRRTVPVKVNIQGGPPLGFSNQIPQVDLAQAIVVGPQSLVELVQTVAVNLNLNNARANLQQSLNLTAETEQGYPVEGVHIEPSQATVSVQILRLVNFVSLPVVADFTGSPAQGYWVSQVRTNPSLITAQAPQDAVQSVAVLKTQSIDLSGAVSSFSRRVSIAVPQGMTLLDRADIQVDVTILPLQSTATFQIAPQITGTAQGLRARTDRPSITVVVTGDAVILKDLTPDAIKLVLNVDGKPRGASLVTPVVNLPPNVKLVSLDAPTVQVTLE